jgi:hypothetical protein
MVEISNAGGESGPMVLKFAVPSMDENTYFATQVLYVTRQKRTRVLLLE